MRPHLFSDLMPLCRFSFVENYILKRTEILQNNIYVKFKVYMYNTPTMKWINLIFKLFM